jgi:hypothetical protein
LQTLRVPKRRCNDGCFISWFGHPLGSATVRHERSRYRRALLRHQMMSAAERAKARPATTCARHARRLPTGSSLPIARALAPHLPLGCAHDPKAKGRPLRPSPPPSAPCAPQPSLSLAHAHSSLPLLRGTHPGIIRPRKAESCRYSGPHGHKNIYISHSCHPDRVPF